jgi:ribonucleotide monophosphatase NagD (HAD superfamily)
VDIALGRMGGSKTVLVRSGISGAIYLEKLPERHRPHAVIDGVSDLQALAAALVEELAVALVPDGG